MKTVVGRMIGSGVALALSMVAYGSSLNLDGIFLVKGMSMAGARVIVLTAGEEPRILTTDVEHFTLRLDLNTNYMLSFERAGCVSKQLQFNTSLPKDYPVAGDFYFPFQVTLEPLPEGQHYTYAGPVGAIHFDKSINGFGYDTDYRITKDDMLTKRLELAHDQLARQASPGLKPEEEATPALASTGRPAVKGQVDIHTPYEVIAPMVSRTAPMVHVLETPVAPKEAPPTYAKPLRVALDELRPKRPEPEILALHPVPNVQDIQVPMAVPSQWWKEVQADRLHVTTTITVQEDQRAVEYRRVVSYYGGITYFRDGLPCSEVIYEQGIAR